MSEEDNRKRNFQQDDIDSAISSKRAALGISSDPVDTSVTSGEQESFYFKILVPQSITGLIIGKGGSIISQLNSQCGARIKLSQNSEFFPGANERILVLYGPREGLANAVKELVSRICEATERKQPGAPNMGVDMYGNPIASNRGSNGSFQVRVLIPKVASGTLIGKGGSVIKQMSEISGSKMQLGDESDPLNTRERVVILNSPTVESAVLGVQTLMAQLLSETKVRTYHNTGTNYGQVGLGGMPSAPMSYRPPMGMIPQATAPHLGMGTGVMGGMYGQPQQQGYNRVPGSTPYSSTPMTMYPQQHQSSRGYAPYQPYGGPKK